MIFNELNFTTINIVKIIWIIKEANTKWTQNLDPRAFN